MPVKVKTKVVLLQDDYFQTIAESLFKRLNIIKQTEREQHNENCY